MFQIGVDGVNELGDAVDGQPFELPFVEFTEEAFHEIGPRGAGGDEVEVDAGIFGQPVPDFFVLVRGVIVEDDVDLEIGIDAAFDGLDELQELLMPVPGHAFMDDMACGDVEGREEGGGAR